MVCLYPSLIPVTFPYADALAPTGYNPNAAAANKKQKHKHRQADFTEAWVEFLDKTMAKTVARMLNAQVIGGKKGDRWRDDIWTMKYLSGFKWEMLGEQVGKSLYTSTRSPLSLPKELIHPWNDAESLRRMDRRYFRVRSQTARYGYGRGGIRIPHVLAALCRISAASNCSQQSYLFYSFPIAACLHICPFPSLYRAIPSISQK